MSSPIPFVDIGSENAALESELHAAFTRVLSTSGFILGEEVERFEDEFARFCGVDHCVGVASGTAALTLSFLAAGVRRGDEIIVPAHTFIASALAVVHAGATPVFCDVDADTGLIDPDAAAEAITARTAGILAVHLYGQACDTGELSDLAGRHGLALFEDAAQAHGAVWDGRRVGSAGTSAAFSFYPSKNLGALGDGGAVCTSDLGLARRVRELRHVGQRRKGEHAVLGFNERLDGIQAAFLRTKLPHLERWNDSRRTAASIYDGLLAERLQVLPDRGDNACVYHVYPLRVRNRDVVADALGRHGIETAVHYSPAVPDQPVFSREHDPDAFPNARAWAAEELSLPMYPGLREADIVRVAELISNTAEPTAPLAWATGRTN